ncbi:MAG: HpcH/HpaI aldolase/citrate lyase family protein [Candidatus Eisenbacteria bacterium]|nr:HpcH/HpaI aldolase/citrate lyase family protein [Candidatus Eisenbacteria bacterium]
MTIAAEAGRRGDKVRSDCWVRLETADSGGVRIELSSKVASLYGEAIRAQAETTLKTLGVERAGVTIEDFGAVPFALAARIEAAVRRALPETTEEALPEFADCCRYGTKRERFRRTRLYLPGNEPKFFLNAGLHHPDGVILDLEDSVAPEEKDAARLMVRNALRTVDFYGAERMVRINQLPLGMDDLDAIVPHNVHVVLIPKVESAETVRDVAARIDEIRKERGIEAPVFLMPIVESALGVVRAFEIASAASTVVALTIGLEDYTADIGAPRTAEGRESFHARSAVVNAARAARVQPIDSVFSDVSDMEALRRNALESKALGFDGMGCIHPRQVAVVHDAFAPTEKELEKARRIVAAYEEARSRGSGVVSLGSKMIDPPVVKRALQVVRMAGGEDAS